MSLATSRRRGLALGVAVGFSLLSACKDPASSLGKTPARARINASELFGSLTARFGPQERENGYADMRAAISKYALIPSKLANDSSLWTSVEGPDRMLLVAGSGSPGRYRLRLDPKVTHPTHPSEYRRTARLRVLGDGEFEWQVRDELAVGGVTGNELGDALRAAFGAAQVSTEADIRTAHRATMPRLTERLGRLVTLDTIRTAPLERGAVLVSLSASLHPERLKEEFPNFAKYLTKYIGPAKMQVVVYDDLGGRWWEMDLDEQRFMLRAAVRNGRLTPLNAAPRTIPEVLRVHVDASTKIGIFGIGFRRLRGDIALTRETNEKGFTARFNTEPDWKLPPLVERLIRSPLRRPFAGEGALLAMRITDQRDAQTIIARDYQVAVKESAIMRWLGGLGRKALDDFRRGAEREADIYYGQVLAALQADVLAMLGEPAAQTTSGR
ncbi:MAG TPA: hypothetical protein VJ596_08680 [Gemmatimonadaceae bacterium]|nr:hypothetical protein [Gemmatimonadaceae bacterium]